MAPDLVAALKAGWAIVHFVTVSLPGHTIRWTDAGFARWGSGVWKARDPIFGTLHEISDITDGIDDDASPVTLTITPPSMAALEAMASADAQGGWVVIHLAAIDPATGTLATPYQLHMGELDQPRLAAGKVRRLEYDIITGDARGLQPNEEQRQSDAFRQLIWPGERGDEFATDGTKLVYWREDEPRNAVGLLSGRGGGKKDDNKAIEFSYEPNAPLAFPFGRVGVGGSLRYRVGYGPTNRWQSVVATVGASGPVKGLVNASFDDEVTFFDANNRATNGSHRGEMWFSFLPGAQPSPALTAPTGPNADGGPAGLWSPAHKLSGRPCFMWTGKENSKKSEYRGGLPKPVLTIDGLYGYDPLQDSTRGGTGNCRIDNPTTWPWLNEGARAALNWAIGRWEGQAASGRYGVPYQTWAVGGIAAPIQTIDVQAFAHAARIADANNWKVAAVPRSDEDKVDVLNDLLKASGAVRSRRCGMISCVSFGAPTPSVLTATEADTIAAPQVSLAPSRLDRRNTGIPSFLSAQHRWELTPIAAVTDQDWFEEDGGRHTEGYSYRYVPAAKQAAQLCYLDMATEREKVEAEVNFKAWMMALEPGVAFDWAAREYGLDGTKVRVWKRTWSPRSCSVKIKFREETDAKYAKAFAQTGEAPPAFAPPLPPVVSVPVNRPIWTSDPYPVTGSPGTIKVAPHEAMMPWGEIVSIAGAIISGLDGTKIYGVFWRPADGDGQGGGVEVEAYPASSHMADGSWIFLGWQAPANELGEFPPLPVAPPGHGGIGEAPGLPIAGDITPTAPTIVSIRNDIEAAFGDIFNVSELVGQTRADLEAADAQLSSTLGQTRADLEAADASLYGNIVVLDNRAGVLETQTQSLETNKASVASLNAQIVRINDVEAVNATQALALVDLENGKVALSEYNTLKGEVVAGRDGQPSLLAKIENLKAVDLDLQQNKASVQAVSALGVRTESLEADITGLQQVTADLEARKATSEALNAQRLRIDDVEAVNATQALALVDLENGKVALSEYNTLKGEVQAARDGAPSLLSQIQNLKSVDLDLQQNKASVASVDALTARTAHTEADIIDLENALANEVTARAEAISQVSARAGHRANLIDNPSGADDFRGWVKEGSPASYVDDDRLAGRIFVVYGYMVSQVYPAAAGDQHSLGFVASPLGDGGHVRLQYVTPSGLMEGALVLAGSAGYDVRRRSTAPSTAPAGTTGFRVVVVPPSGGVLPVWAIKVNFGSVAADFSDDYSATVLAATVAEQSLAIVDLENQQTIASWRIKSAASGSKPAIIEAVSALGGSYVAFGAEQIYFGDSTVFDDATDTMQTVVGGRVRVVAYGAPFGAANNLLEWWGPTGVALGAMNTTNGLQGRMTSLPYVFDNTINAPFVAVCNPPTSGRVVTTPGTYTSTVVTVEVTGGSGLYEYQWGYFAGSTGATATSPTGAATQINQTVASGETKSVVFLCMVRDTVTGRTTTATYRYTLTHSAA